MIFLLIVLFIGLVLFEVPELIRKKSWRELVVFSLIMSIAFLVSLLETLHIEIPNPVKDTQYFVKSLIPFGYD